MLNYICTLFTSYLVNGPFKTEGSTAQTELIAEGIWFGKLVPGPSSPMQCSCCSCGGSHVHIPVEDIGGIPAEGQWEPIPLPPEQPESRVNMFLILSMTISGGIAALAGNTEVFGKYHRFIEGFSPSFGLRESPWPYWEESSGRCAFDRIAFGIMDMGSLRMSRETVVTNMVTVVQSLVILW